MYMGRFACQTGGAKARPARDQQIICSINQRFKVNSSLNTWI
jgi:hypothetical protein